MQFLEFDMIQYKVRNYIDNFTITFIMPFIKKIFNLICTNTSEIIVKNILNIKNL